MYSFNIFPLLFLHAPFEVTHILIHVRICRSSSSSSHYVVTNFLTSSPYTYIKYVHWCVCVCQFKCVRCVRVILSFLHGKFCWRIKPRFRYDNNNHKTHTFTQRHIGHFFRGMSVMCLWTDDIITDQIWTGQFVCKSKLRLRRT